ncbi:MAG: hypothetical protein ACLRQF_06275 [Thomasclavelia ramosa]
MHCGRCVDVCPIGLIPQLLYRYARTGDKENFLKVHGNDCMSAVAVPSHVLQSET